MSLLSPHPTVSLLGLALSTHGLLFAVGAETALLVLVRLARARGLPAADLPGIVLTVFVAGLAGARIGFFLSYPGEYVSLAGVLSIWQGGLVSYFGLAIGLPVAALLLRRVGGQPTLAWLDLACIAGLAGWSVGRLGNYWAADSVGVPSTVWQAFYSRVPIQLLEALLCLLLALLLPRLLRWRRALPGLVACAALAGYAAGRLVIDTWRDEPMLAFSLHTSQVASLILLLAAIGLLSHRIAPARA